MFRNGICVTADLEKASVPQIVWFPYNKEGFISGLYFRIQYYQIVETKLTKGF